MTRMDTRRGYLRSVSGLGVAGLYSFGGRDKSSTAKVAAGDLLIPETAVPTGFTTYEADQPTPLVEALQSTGVAIDDVDTAVQAYWRGGSRESPQEVLASQALVSPEPLSHEAIMNAGHRSHDVLANSYAEDTGPRVSFELAHTNDGRTADWRLDIYRSCLFTDGREPLYTDVLRQQHFGNVVLGTVVFGPTEETPTVSTRLDRYATAQRGQYRVQGGH